MLNCWGQGSAVNGRWRPRYYIPMERALGNRRRERRKTKGMIEMGDMFATCHFSYLRVSEK